MSISRFDGQRPLSAPDDARLAILRSVVYIPVDLSEADRLARRERWTMAKKKSKSKSKSKSKKKSGGTLMGMRSGFKTLTGSSKKKKSKEEITFLTVFSWCLVAALAVVLIYRLSN